MEDKELIAYCQLTRSDLCDVEVVSDDIMRFLIRRTRTCRVKFGISNAEAPNCFQMLCQKSRLKANARLTRKQFRDKLSSSSRVTST